MSEPARKNKCGTRGGLRCGYMAGRAASPCVGNKREETAGRKTVVNEPFKTSSVE